MIEIKYVISLVGNHVSEVDVDTETNKVRYRNTKHVIDTDYRKVYDTYNDAVDALQTRIESNIEGNRKTYERSLKSLEDFKEKYRKQ